MGQLIGHLHYQNLHESSCGGRHNHKSDEQSDKNPFPDLQELPPELALAILSNLNATDLCLAACVWSHLANDDCLWQELCLRTWPFCSAYKRWSNENSFRQLYLKLDEARLTFNADAFEGMSYLHYHQLVDNEPLDIARFLHGAHNLDKEQERRYLQKRPDVLDELLELKNYSNQFLPNALRQFFQEIPAPNERNEYLSRLVERFSRKFVQCNPKLNLSIDMVYILCFSLIMLSVDLCSPHVKNKMSKREFIRNTRHAASQLNEDFLGDLYDNIYLIGHVAPTAGRAR